MRCRCTCPTQQSLRPLALSVVDAFSAQCKRMSIPLQCCYVRHCACCFLPLVLHLQLCGLCLVALRSAAAWLPLLPALAAKQLVSVLCEQLVRPRILPALIHIHTHTDEWGWGGVLPASCVVLRCSFARLCDRVASAVRARGNRSSWAGEVGGRAHTLAVVQFAKQRFV